MTYLHGIISAVVLAGLLIAVPAVLIGLVFWLVSRRLERGETFGKGMPVGRYALIMAAAGLAVTALVSLVFDAWVASQQAQDRGSLAIPVLLVLALALSAKLPARPVAGPLFGALGATVGAALFFPFIAAVEGGGDGSALWGIGALFAWAFCGIPLLVAAVVIAVVRTRATGRGTADTATPADHS